VPGKYTQAWNHTYLPTKFRCMQLGITWSPDLTTSINIAGERDEVVFSCQQKCQDTEGCAHFTVMFPNLCRLAGHLAVPLPAELTLSGPATQDCDSFDSEAPLGHTLMRKFSDSPQPEEPSSSLRITFVAPLALATGGLVVALAAWRRRQPDRSGERGEMVRTVIDLEESFSPYDME